MYQYMHINRFNAKYLQNNQEMNFSFGIRKGFERGHLELLVGDRALAGTRPVCRDESPFLSLPLDTCCSGFISTYINEFITP